MTLGYRGWLLLLAAPYAAAQQDAVDVLARFGELARDNASRARNYTCVETIERQYFRAKLTTTPRYCDDLAAEKKKPGYGLTLESTDRLRLEVRAAATGEMYSWPGANAFDGRPLWEIIGYGPAASGPFAMSLLQVVQGDATDFAFLGETGFGGRKLFQYSFRVPAGRSHYRVGLAQGTIAISWDGTLLLDPETSELVRMTTRTSELPSGAFGCEHTTAAEYGRVKIGARQFLLARETRQRFIDRSGAEVENVVTFSGCREYGAEAAAEPVKAALPRHLVLPAGLPVTIALSSRIDSATAAGGDRFTGKLAEPVKDSRGMILLPEGAAVAGRMIEVAAHMRPPLEVAIVFRADSVQVDGAEVPIHLTGKTPVKGGWLREILSSLTIGAGGHIGGPPGGAADSKNPPVQEEKINALRFPGTRKILEPGFKTEWVTVKP